MNTQGIGKQDAWAQFMKLTQEARLRNAGLSSRVSGVSVSKERADLRVPNKMAPQIIRGMSYSKGEPEVKKIILGGQFDAYA